jgi:hypothetical protein
MRKSLFDSATLQIGLFEARGVAKTCGDVERQDRNAVVLPLAGVFAKHDAPGRQVIGTPSHAGFVGLATSSHRNRSTAAARRGSPRTGCCRLPP